jgi:3-oxoadipate enol-lactonase
VVVLSHGFLIYRTVCGDQVAVLRGTHRVITWDERGFGDTVYDEQPSTTGTRPTTCLRVLEQLGVDQAVFDVMSQCGFVELRTALLAPGRVRGPVLLDSQAGPKDAEAIPLYQGMIDSWVADAPTDELVELVWRACPSDALPASRINRRPS